MFGVIHAIMPKKNAKRSAAMLAIAILSGCAGVNTVNTESTSAAASNECKSSTDTFCVEGSKDKAARLNRQGLEYAVKEDYDKALDYFKQAIEIDPFDPEFHYNLGVTYDFKGMKKESEAAYMKVLSTEPDNPRLALFLGNAYFNLACLHALQGHTDLALGFLERLFSIDSNTLYHKVMTDTDLASLRDEPRYKQIIKMKPGNNGQPAETSKTEETSKPVETSQLQEAVKPEETSKPGEAVKSKKSANSRKSGKTRKKAKPSKVAEPEAPVK